MVSSPLNLILLHTSIPKPAMPLSCGLVMEHLQLEELPRCKTMENLLVEVTLLFPHRTKAYNTYIQVETTLSQTIHHPQLSTQLLPESAMRRTVTKVNSHCITQLFKEPVPSISTLLTT